MIDVVETAQEHIRNALQILKREAPIGTGIFEPVTLQREEHAAIEKRLNAALERMSPAGRTPVGVTVVRNNLVVICDDGSAWMWGQNPETIEKLPEHERFKVETGMARVDYTWIRFHSPIPGTRDAIAYEEARV